MNEYLKVIKKVTDLDVTETEVKVEATFVVSDDPEKVAKEIAEIINKYRI